VAVAIAYLFERFPSFTQTFCYREIAELNRQGVSPQIFSIRRTDDEPPQPWDRAIVEQVTHLPAEEALVREIGRLLRKHELPTEAANAIEQWGRKSDFLRVYQAAWIGLRLRDAGVRHVHGHFAGMAARTAFWIKRFFGIPFSFTAHANDVFAPKTFAVALGDLVDAAGAVITVSDYGVRFLKQRFPAAASKIHRVYNGIELSRFSPAEMKGSPPKIITVGRLISKKGFADLISACALLKTRGCSFHCAIIGEGPLEDALRSQIERDQLQAHVTLSGPLSEPEIAARLTSATVFALPCVVEPDGGRDNLPTVIMEAMASALPVVSTRVAGVPEMVESGASGLLVEQHDPPALAAAIEQLITDRGRAQQFGARGRKIAEERFAIDATVGSLRTYLFQLCS
jgi:glycosyltransferase involved in cell wall biosynthesis